MRKRILLFGGLAAAIGVCLVVASRAEARLAPCDSYGDYCVAKRGGHARATSPRLLRSASGSALRSRSLIVTRWAKNALGNYVWRYKMRLDWTYDGRRVLSVDRSRPVSCCGLFWDFTGHIDSWGSSGATWVRRGTQGKFRACVPQILCFQSATPWVQATVYRDGSYGWSVGG